MAEAIWSDVTIGAAIAGLAPARVAAPLQFESISWINFALGSRLVIAPFVIGTEMSASR